MINTVSKRVFPVLLWIKPSRLLASGLFILLGFGQICNAQTHNQRWYQVELIAFARLVEDSQEHWPTNIKLGYPQHRVELKDPAAKTTTQQDPALSNPAAAVDILRDPYYFLPETEKKLLKHATALRRDSRYRVLFHESWRQLIGSQNKAPALIIHGGNAYGNHYELEGSITLSVAQYLQVKTKLWLSQFEMNNGQAPGEWPKLPKIPGKLQAELPTEGAGATAGPSVPDQWQPSTTDLTTQESPELNEPYFTKRVVLMEQDRRMRSSEIHYLDHPLLGLIIQITPYDMPY